MAAKKAKSTTKAKEDREEIPGGVLAEGEQTGHMHRLGRSRVYEGPMETREFEVGGAGDVLSHQEHGPVAIPAGEWASGRVREYDHFSEEARVVAD